MASEETSPDVTASEDALAIADDLIGAVGRFGAGLSDEFRRQRVDDYFAARERERGIAATEYLDERDLITLQTLLEREWHRFENVGPETREHLDHIEDLMRRLAARAARGASDGVLPEAVRESLVVELPDGARARIEAAGALTPQSQEAIAAVVRAAWEQLSERPERPPEKR
jgi:hypothetical protein